MHIVLCVLKKEFLQLRRDPRIFPLLFVAPLLQLFFMGYAATMDIKHIPLLVWDQDHTSLSRELISHLTGNPYFDLVGRAAGYAEIEKALRQGRAQVALVIPAGFQHRVRGGGQATVQAVIDGADSNQAQIAQNYLSIIVQQQSARVMIEELRNLAPRLSTQAPALAAGLAGVVEKGELLVSPQPRLWYNPDLRSANFMVPGVVVMILLVITTMLTALAVVREKEVGTMEQVIVTPIAPWQFILGKLTPFVIIGFIEITLVILVAVLWFHVPFRGNVLSLYFYASLFLFTTLGLGLLLSTISQNQQQAMMTAFFIIFTMILLSGFMFPIENMPRPVQYLTVLIPMRWFLVIVRNVFLKGSPISLLWDQALALFCLGVIVIFLSIRRFHKTLD